MVRKCLSDLPETMARVSRHTKGCNRACDSLWLFTLGADNGLVQFLRAGTLIKSGKRTMDCNNFEKFR